MKSVIQSGSLFVSDNEFWSTLWVLSWDQARTWSLWGDVTDDENRASSIPSVQDLSPLENKVRGMGIQGVKPRYASISVAEQLAIKYQFAFTDEHNIRYAYIGTWISSDLASRIRRLWGDTLALETQNDILSNLLRWNRVQFINIPELTYTTNQGEVEREVVAIIVDIEQDKRFVQAPIDKYYAHKEDMKWYFEYLYDTHW